MIFKWSYVEQRTLKDHLEFKGCLGWLAIIWRVHEWRAARKWREKQQANALGNVVERYRAAPRGAANSSNNFVPIT